MADEERRAKSRDRSRLWRASNPERYREQKRRWREANREKARDSQRKYLASERGVETGRAYRESNKDAIAAKKRRYYEDNSEAIRKRERNRARKDPQVNRDRVRAWRDSNPNYSSRQAQERLRVQREATRETAGRRGFEYSGREDAYLIDNHHLPTIDQAFVLNRSLPSIITRRRKLRQKGLIP